MLQGGGMVSPFRLVGSRGFWLALFALAATAGVVFAVLALRPVPEGEPVVVAKQDISPGATVQRGDVRVIALPPQAIPQGALLDPEDALGQVPTLAIPAGTVLTENLVGSNAQSSVIPPGFAQTVVVVDEATAFVTPGDRIEIWGVDPACQAEQCELSRIAQDVAVVSVHETGGGGFASERHVGVTLILRAVDVGAVLQNAQMGGVHFVLR